MKKVLVTLYWLAMAAGLGLGLMLLVSVRQGQATAFTYQAAKDTRSGWSRLAHPFTSDFDYVVQPGGGADKLSDWVLR